MKTTMSKAFAGKLAAFLAANPAPDAAAVGGFADDTMLALAGSILALIDLYAEQRDGMPQTPDWKDGFAAGMACVAQGLMVAVAPPAQALTVTEGIASGEEVMAL